MPEHEWWLAQQAPPPLVHVWTPIRNVELERALWLEVLQFHHRCGIAMSPHAVRDYRAAAPYINLERIEQRERVTRHDVKARIEEFNYMAGHESIHLGMTSADVVDNVAQIKMAESVRVLAGLFPGRFDYALGMLERWPLRGIKGAVGTQQDQLDLLGDERLVDELDRGVAAAFGFRRVLGSVGQVYPRSLDLDIGSALAVCVADIRHPMNGAVVGYLSMMAGYAGETWNEGDVSTSVVRRVALPGLVLAVGCLASSL